ncbi:MAG: TetR/AcrR family transcriptional regulator [Desulfobacula sp.]|nr:TetR/AcrR family transcriptional regulator [Desulfobacula sp.]
MGRKSIAKERRTQIIEAFYQCVVDMGLARASIRKIADQAGVKPSTLHHYFSNRDEIIEEAVIYFTDMIFQSFQEQMDALNGSVDQITKGIEFIFSKGMINAEYTGFFLECCVASRNNERIKDTIAQLFDRFRKAIIRHLELMDGFCLLTAEDQQMLAVMVVALHEGIELQWFAQNNAVSLKQALETTLHLIRFFIQERTRSPKKQSEKNEHGKKS